MSWLESFFNELESKLKWREAKEEIMNLIQEIFYAEEDDYVKAMLTEVAENLENLD